LQDAPAAGAPHRREHGAKEPERADDVRVELGEELLIDLGDGPQICTIVEVTETQAMVDLNHPMAGFRLHFDITVQAVREALAEEIEHGHVHGADGTEMHEDDEEYEDEGDDEGDDEQK
jgi:FKBP-type peptidyl-prolyl cis-trans isomerase SlyD